MSVSVLAAYGIDLVVGDPRGVPHPVRCIGAAIAYGESLARARFARTPLGERVAGASLALAVIAGAAAASAAVVAAARRVDALAGSVVEVVAAASTIATRDLLDEARAVHRALAAGDLARARARVARIVGRDTHALDAAGVARAVIETLAESTCDGIAAPIFFLACGGVPAAMAFKAASTLDSMIGHREPPYRFFGTAAARIDDAANVVPARLSALAIAFVAPLAGGSMRRAFATIAADARKHRSPNAGFPEAAMAGALGVRLGGALSYHGEPAATPLLCAHGRTPAVGDVAAAIRLCALASLAVAAVAALAVRRA